MARTPGWQNGNAGPSRRLQCGPCRLRILERAAPACECDRLFGEFLSGCVCRPGNRSQRCQSQQGASGELGIVCLPDRTFHSLTFPWCDVKCGITSVMNSSSERMATSCG